MGTAKLHKGHWHNWSGSVQSQPREIAQPTSIDELAQQMAAFSRSGRHVRVVGAGHSFTPIAQSNDVLMSLDKLQGIISVDAEQGTATVYGGTRLFHLGPALHKHGLAQENMGDINQQSIAGAISTNTHGTGLGFGSIATQVLALTLVTANGDVVDCSPSENPELFKAAQVSVGTLGVIAKVTLRVVPSKRLRLQTRRERLSTCLEHLEEYQQQNNHFEFYWFPYTDMGQVKFLNETDAPATRSNLWSTFNKLAVENGALWLLSESCRMFPRISPRVSKISVAGITPLNEVNYSHQLYATPRMVKFQEMEYSIPVAQFSTVMGEIQARINERRYRVNFPIECRFVKGDNIWLSTTQGRDSAYIAIHMYRGMEYQRYFREIEEIFTQHEGRPHWGKIHTRDAAYLASVYPHWEDFRRVRAQIDPQGLFLNDYLRTLFAADVTAPVAAVIPSGSLASE